MGLLAFLIAPTGVATTVTAQDLRKEVAEHGLDASKIDIEVDGDKACIAQRQLASLDFNGNGAAPIRQETALRRNRVVACRTF